jgi:hypothetical protein
MQIAHINNTAGIASIIAHGQKNYGNLVDVFVFNRKTQNLFGGTKINYKFPVTRWNFLRKLQEYDVWHYHYPYGTLKKELERRNNAKIYLKHYHGDDLRGTQDYDYCLVSTPDLLAHAPNGRWLPNPIMIQEIESIPEKSPTSRIPKIAHYPYYKSYSAEDYFTNVLSILRDEDKIELVEIFDMPHLLALNKMSECDIIIGKILPNIGWFGKFELEGMALGKPVIAYVSDNLFEEYNPPIYRTSKDTFKYDLEYLIENEDERLRLGKEGKAFVRKYHSIDSALNIIAESYKKVAKSG